MADRLQFRGYPKYEIPAVPIAEREIMFDLTSDTLVLGRNRTYVLTEGTGYTKTEIDQFFEDIDVGGGEPGSDGKGWKLDGTGYDSSTGIVTFASDDGLGFATGDLRGQDGAPGKDGTSLLLKGSFDSVGPPTSEVDPAPEAGDLWIDVNGDGWAFDGSSWSNVGDIRGPEGASGKGWKASGTGYDSSTGIVTFASDDGLEFSTSDLRGGPGDPGDPGADGKGWKKTGTGYDPSTGKVTFASDDGLGFTTGDLRGPPGDDIDLSGYLKFGVNISDNFTNFYSSTTGKKIEFVPREGQVLAESYSFNLTNKADNPTETGIYSVSADEFDLRSADSDNIRVTAGNTVFPKPIIDRTGAEVLHNYVNVKAYGARGDGSSYDSRAIQRAFDDAEENGAILFPPGTYLLNETVQTDKSLHILATGATFRIIEPVAGFVFDACDKANQFDFKADYVLGSNAIRIKNTSSDRNSITRIFNEAQLIKVVSKAVDYGNRDAGSRESQYRSGEWTYAYDLTQVSGTIYELQLKNPLRFPKGVSFVDNPDGDEQYINAYDLRFRSDVDNRTYELYPKVIILSGATMSWVGGEIEYPKNKQDETSGGKAVWRQPCLTINGYTGPVVDQLKINRGYGVGILIDGSVHSKVTNCTIENLWNNTSRGNYGYGVVEGGTCMGNVSQCTFINTRHGYTTGANAFTWGDRDEGNYKKDRLQGGKTQSSVIADCHGTGPKNAPFDTHMDAEDIIFNNCISEGGFAGFAIRGRGILLNNCKAINHTRPYLIFTEYQKGDPGDDLFTANKEAGATTAALNNCVAECVNGIPIQFTSCKMVYLSNLVIRNNNHQMIANSGSNLVFSGVHDYKVTGYDGRVPVTSAPPYNNEGDYRTSVFTTVAGGKTFNDIWKTRNTFETNCVINIDCTEALPANNESEPNLALFRGYRTYLNSKLPPGSGPGQIDHPSNKLLTYMNINGVIRARLGPAFSALTTAYGWITGSGTEDGMLSYSLVDSNGNERNGDDPDFRTGLYGHEINAESTDGKIYYYNATLKPKSNPLDNSYTFDYTFSGGKDKIFYPYVPLAHLMDVPGSYIKQVIKFFKTSGSGSPEFKIRIGGETEQVLLDRMVDDYAEVETIVYCDGPASKGNVLNNMRVFVKFTTGDGTKMAYQAIQSDFDRTKRYVADIRVDANNGVKFEVSQTELLASAISSLKVWDEEAERLGID